MSPGAALDGRQRRFLRALAQPRRAVVQVGGAGITPGVVAAVGAALLEHELVKVRFHEPDDKRGSAAAIAEACDAHLCGVVGHTVILYRRHPETPRIALPGAGSRARRSE
ncbi:RNA-binding protein [Myxococcaceae bacterium]|jgi:RNA-binding protein|nr:RNA-binding protein [Myxococcaceae bacterium]